MPAVRRPEQEPLPLKVVEKTIIRLDGMVVPLGAPSVGVRVHGIYTPARPNVAHLIDAISPLRRVYGILQQVGEDGWIVIQAGEGRSVRLKQAERAHRGGRRGGRSGHVLVSGRTIAMYRAATNSAPALFVGLQVGSSEPTAEGD